MANALVKLALAASVISSNSDAMAQTGQKMEKKILFVVTSHDTKGNTGEPTGYYLGEVSHPWEVLSEAGYEIDFVSPKGGKAPVDGFDLTDPVNKKFWENEEARKKVEHTLAPEAVKPKEYLAIFYAGGHGAMWDLADDVKIAAIASEIYEQNGLVAAVCHGPAGLVNIKLTDGSSLVNGKKVNAFTNEEEAASRNGESRTICSGDEVDRTWGKIREIRQLANARGDRPTIDHRPKPAVGKGGRASDARSVG